MCLHRGFCAVSLCKDALVFAPAKPVYYGYSNQQNAPQKTAVLCDTGKGEFIMARVYNFSAGPSMLPEKVLKQAQAELLEYGDSGQSVMEMSHRSKWFDAIIKDTEATLRRVMNIPDNYKVGFFQGGATQQFAMVPLNFMTTGKADYLVTGNFSNLAAKEAAKFGEVNIVASSKDKNFTYIPDVNAINYDKDASYIHICQNNTIFGTQFVEVPQMKNKTSNRRLIFQLAAVVVLIVIAYAMTIVGRGHTVYLDNKKLEYNGKTYDTPYKAAVLVDGEQVAKLYDRERGSATCIGQKFTVTLEITEKKGGSETTQTYTIPLPKNMDGIIINLPAYLAGLGEDAYLTEFIPSPDAEIVEEDTPSGDDFGMDDMTMDEVPVG